MLHDSELSISQCHKSLQNLQVVGPDVHQRRIALRTTRAALGRTSLAEIDVLLPSLQLQKALSTDSLRSEHLHGGLRSGRRGFQLETEGTTPTSSWLS